jgi:hypothetical protein
MLARISAMSRLPMIELVATSFQGYAASTSVLTITKPAGTREGDLMVAFVANNGSTMTFTPPTGWREVIDPGTRGQPSLYWKYAGSSEPADYTWTPSTSAKPAGLIVTFRNAQFGVCGAITSGANPLILPSVTTPTSDCLLLAFAIRDAGSVTPATPAGMSVVYVDSDANAPSFGVFSQAVDAGSTGTRSCTVFNSSNTGGVMCFLMPKHYAPVEPELVAYQSGSAVSGNLTINKPAGTVDGDLMVAFVGGDGANSITWTGPAGWTEAIDAGSKPGIAVYYKTASSEGSSYTFNQATGSGTEGVIVTMRNAAWDATGGAVAGSSTLTPSVTVATDFSTLLCFGMRAAASIAITTNCEETIASNADATSPSWILASDAGMSPGATSRTVSPGSSANVQAVCVSIKPS